MCASGGGLAIDQKRPFPFRHRENPVAPPSLQSLDSCPCIGSSSSPHPPRSERGGARRVSPLEDPAADQCCTKTARNTCPASSMSEIFRRWSVVHVSCPVRARPRVGRAGCRRGVVGDRGVGRVVARAARRAAPAGRRRVSVAAGGCRGDRGVRQGDSADPHPPQAGVRRRRVVRVLPNDVLRSRRARVRRHGDHDHHRRRARDAHHRHGDPDVAGAAVLDRAVGRRLADRPGAAVLGAALRNLESLRRPGARRGCRVRGPHHPPGRRPPGHHRVRLPHRRPPAHPGRPHPGHGAARPARRPARRRLLRRRADGARLRRVLQGPHHGPPRARCAVGAARTAHGDDPVRRLPPRAPEPAGLGRRGAPDRGAGRRLLALGTYFGSSGSGRPRIANGRGSPANW